MSKKIKLFILCSVVLNVLLSGAMIGHFSHQWGKKKYFAERIQALPEDKQALVEKTLAEAFQDGRILYKAIHKERQEAMRILAAEPFDEMAYDSHVEKIHSLRTQQKQRMSQAIKALAKQLTPEERTALAEILRRPPHWRKGGCKEKPQ